MTIGAINTALNSGVSYKTVQNYFSGQKLLDKASQLVSDLENLRSTPDDITDLVETDAQKAQAKLDELIRQSIDEITEIREARGITEAAGQNKPLDELFQTIKGSVFNSSV